jgi:hypothetical protein
VLLSCIPMVGRDGGRSALKAGSAIVERGPGFGKDPQRVTPPVNGQERIWRAG